MTIEEKRTELENLLKLHVDLEKQMKNFDEIIPYERQSTAMIFSPRLLNIMLACGPQIEAVTRWIASWCDMETSEPDQECQGRIKQFSVPKMIRKINEKDVLSILPIYSLQHKIQFTAFEDKKEWWDLYNNLKHGLANSHKKINYRVVMDALAALASLHCIAAKLSENERDISSVLDSKRWIIDPDELETVHMEKHPMSKTIEWYSELFVIRGLYNIW